MKLLALSAITAFSVTARADHMTGITNIKTSIDGVPYYSCQVTNNTFETLDIVKVNYQFICNDEVEELTEMDSFCSDTCKLQAKRTISLPGPEVCEQGTAYPVDCSVEYETTVH